MTYPSGTGQVLWSCSGLTTSVVKVRKYTLSLREKLAEWTGLEPATSCVTGSFGLFGQNVTYSILGVFRLTFRGVSSLFQSAVECRRTAHKMKVSGTGLGLARSINFGELGRPDSERLPISIGQIRRNINLFLSSLVPRGIPLSRNGGHSEVNGNKRGPARLLFNFIFINCFQLGGSNGGSSYGHGRKLG